MWVHLPGKGGGATQSVIRELEEAGPGTIASGRAG